MAETTALNSAVSSKRRLLLRNITMHPGLYLMVLPGVVFLILIRLVPIAGSVIAWQNYSIFRGMLKSPWVGWKNFQEMFAYYDFYRIFRNTLLIGLYRVVFGFPVPIILALLLNEVRSRRFQRFAQTCIYLPYFLSWVVVAQLFIHLLRPETGLVNVILTRTLGVAPIFFFGQEKLFHGIVTASYIWKFSGYQSIVYLAAITTIDPSLYESAAIDGANRWTMIWKITLPSILPVTVIMLLLAVGQFMEIGFDQIYTMMNPLVLATADIFDTFVYRTGLIGGHYSFTTAVGLFKSIIGFVLIMTSNFAAKQLTGEGLFR